MRILLPYLMLDTPTLSISNAELTFNGNVAEFTVTSDIQTTQTHAIKVKPTNNEGSFLGTDFTNNVVKEIMNVNFSQTAPFTYTLDIPTKVDEDSEIWRNCRRNYQQIHALIHMMYKRLMITLQR